MAVKKGQIPQRLSIDPAVEAHMSQQADDPVYGQINRVRRARNMTPGQRRKAERDKARNKVTRDQRPELQAVLERIAAKESIPISQAEEVLIIAGLEAMLRGELDFHKIPHRPSRSPRYDFVLVLPDVPEVRNERSRKCGIFQNQRQRKRQRRETVNASAGVKHNASASASAQLHRKGAEGLEKGSTL